MMNKIKTSTNVNKALKDYKARHNMSDRALSEKLGISRMTLYSRLKKDNWKLSEVYLILSFVDK